MRETDEGRLTPEAEILLLIMAANGGQINKAAADRELTRVLALTPEERAEWRRRISPLPCGRTPGAPLAMDRNGGR
jgi:hypothetical protein